MFPVKSWCLHFLEPSLPPDSNALRPLQWPVVALAIGGGQQRCLYTLLRLALANVRNASVSRQAKACRAIQNGSGPRGKFAHNSDASRVSHGLAKEPRIRAQMAENYLGARSWRMEASGTQGSETCQDWGQADRQAWVLGYKVSLCSGQYTMVTPSLSVWSSEGRVTHIIKTTKSFCEDDWCPLNFPTCLWYLGYNSFSLFTWLLKLWLNAFQLYFPPWFFIFVLLP